MYFEMKELVVNYDRVVALKNVSLSMEKEEIIALIGANGAGKTTIIRAITGLTKIRSGEIWFNGKRIDEFPPQNIVGMGIVAVPEGRRIYPYMSVLDNLLMGAYSRKDRKNIPQDMEKLYKLFPILKERRHQQGGSLSGGEQQQLALVRALIAKPKLLLLDEPSLGLSPKLVKEVGETITMINKVEKMSIILVEQNARMALKISDRGFVLETGTVALQDDSKNMINNDYVRRIYLGG
ncbi:ABC transporter ATP-binding protein [bacterium]|nr:ABC transporter ATP-binding protein [bacterium]